MGYAGQLDSGRTRLGLRLGVLDGLCFAFMVGAGETWIVPFALAIGVSGGDAGLLAGLPLGLGALGGLITLVLIRRLRRRRPVVVTSAAIQCVTLACLPELGALDSYAPVVVLFAFVVYQFAGQMAGTAWASWFGDVVPARLRGRYFGRRTRWIHFTTFLAMISAGVALGVRDRGAGDASLAVFTWIFRLAAAARLASTVLLARIPEPEFGGMPSPREAVRSLRRGPTGRLVALAALFHFWVYVGSPYFTPFMLDVLRLPYGEFTLASGMLVLMKVLALPRWGHAVDRFGAGPVYAVALVLIGVVPLPWVFATGLTLVLIGQTSSGFSWAGHEVGYFSLLLESGSRQLRPLLFVVSGVAIGGAQVLGTLCGKSLLEWTGEGYRTVFLVSAAGRVLVGLSVPLVIGSLLRSKGRRQVLLRVVGFRPSGGLFHRPMFESSVEPKASGTSSPPRSEVGAVEDPRQE